MNAILLVVIFLIVTFGIGFAVGVKHMGTLMKNVEKIQEISEVQKIKKALKEMQHTLIEVIIVQQENTIYIYSPRRDSLLLEWVVKDYPMVEKALKDANLVKVMEKIGEATIISYRPKDKYCTLPVSSLKEVSYFHEQLVSIHCKSN